MNWELKEGLDNYLENINKMDQFLNISRQFGTEKPISELIRDGWKEFLFYLSASDGVLSQKESDVIYEYLGCRYTPDEMNRYIEKHNIYSVEFEETVPDFLQMLSAVDLAIVRKEMENPKLCSRCVDAFSAIGSEFVHSRLFEYEDEKRDYEIYMATLETYLEERKELF